MTDKLIILTADQYADQLRQAAHMGASIALAEFAQSGGAQKPVLSLKEAADFLNIGQNTLRAYVAAEAVPHFKVGRVLKFRRADLAKWEPPTREFSDEKAASVRRRAV